MSHNLILTYKEDPFSRNNVTSIQDAALAVSPGSQSEEEIFAKETMDYLIRDSWPVLTKLELRFLTDAQLDILLTHADQFPALENLTVSILYSGKLNNATDESNYKRI